MRSTRSDSGASGRMYRGWEIVDELPDGVALLQRDETGFRIEILATQKQKAGQNKMHFDLSIANSSGLVRKPIQLGCRTLS